MERHILIVDDETNILNALERLLEEQENIVVHRANSGAEGIEIINDNPQIGVILSDQRMPGMTGTEFLKAVKERHTNVVRMILSGYSELSTITQAINEGSIFKFVTKPWEEEQLLVIVNEAFEYFELAENNRRLTEELKEFNSKLERMVEEKTHRLQLHIASLRVYQDAMEHFPFGVIGIDESNVIVLENLAARKVFSSQGNSLLGLPLGSALTSNWSAIATHADAFNQNMDKVRLQIELNERQITFFRLGSEAKTVGQLIVVTNPY